MACQLLAALKRFETKTLTYCTSLQGLTTRAVMDLNCLCLPFFWSFCSELLKEVNT